MVGDTFTKRVGRSNANNTEDNSAGVTLSPKGNHWHPEQTLEGKLTNTDTRSSPPPARLQPFCLKGDEEKRPGRKNCLQKP